MLILTQQLAVGSSSAYTRDRAPGFGPVSQLRSGSDLTEPYSGGGGRCIVCNHFTPGHLGHDKERKHHRCIDTDAQCAPARGSGDANGKPPQGLQAIPIVHACPSHKSTSGTFARPAAYSQERRQPLQH
jgi:hypothetical protein